MPHPRQHENTKVCYNAKKHDYQNYILTNIYEFLRRKSKKNNFTGINDRFLIISFFFAEVVAPKCLYNSSFYNVGDFTTSMDGCNTCVCQTNGAMKCTNKQCSDGKYKKKMSCFRSAKKDTQIKVIQCNLIKTRLIHTSNALFCEILLFLL